MVAMALGMGAFLALVVVGVDLGRLALTATEVQTVADVAATAGAVGLLKSNGSVGAAKSQAQQAVAQNSVDGKQATIAGSDIHVGHYDYDTETFTADMTPFNAVKADAMATVQNLVAGVWGDTNTTVHKTATAAFVPLGGTVPTLPIALGECHFPPECLDDRCLPSLTQVPNTTNNTAWTGYFGGSSTSDVANYLSGACGGGGTTSPYLRTGDRISLNNGQSNNLTIVECLFCGGQKEFLIPVVECNGSFNQSALVKGFATIVIDSFHCSNGKLCQCGRKGGGTPDGINLHAIVRSTPGTGGGCSGCATGTVALVQ